MAWNIFEFSVSEVKNLVFFNDMRSVSSLLVCVFVVYVCMHTCVWVHVYVRVLCKNDTITEMEQNHNWLGGLVGRVSAPGKGRSQV